MQRGENSVLRVLAADIVRSLLCRGLGRAIFEASSFPLTTMNEFPQAAAADPHWMGRAIDYLRQIDREQVLVEKYTN